MSFEWRKEHCPRTHHPDGTQARHQVGRSYWCPLFPDFMGKCFTFCNLDSPQKCGQCVHWYGHITGQPNKDDDGRHPRFGACMYRIGEVGAGWHNDCPHFRLRPDDFKLAMPDWVESKISEAGLDPASQAARACRVQLHQQWRTMWE